METLPIFDLSDPCADIAKETGGADAVILFLPLPSIGVTNMHIDICCDLIDASWVAEKLAAVSKGAEVTHDYAIQHRTRLKLSLQKPDGRLKDVLRDCMLVFHGADDDLHEENVRYAELRDAIEAYEEDLDRFVPQLPDIIDWYYANFINGALLQLAADAPDYYAGKIAKYPEWQLGFNKSAFSSRLGCVCYTSQDSWLIPSSLSVDQFFEVTAQNYRLSEFIDCSILTIDGKSFIQAEGLTSYFPMNQYFKSKVCASFDQRADEDNWDVFDWQEATFTHSPFLEYMRGDKGYKISDAPCLVHPAGTMIILNDGKYRHVLYDTRPLNPIEIKKLHGRMTESSERLMASIGLSHSLGIDWSSIDDERFEQLCYDIIFAHPKFDADTIRKLGKSRSRDGGRDIEVYEAADRHGAKARKWIFQCKQVRDGSSLGAGKLQDVGDMLDVYEAGGFGVMTSALIDATLYDKLDAICKKRGIPQLHFSLMEMERAVVRIPAISRRYFGTKC